MRRINIYLCIVVALQVAILHSNAFQSSSSYYDPELQVDGIPVMSARSLAQPMNLRYDDQINDASGPSRRSSDSDMEDNSEEDDDDDRDDYNKAGSTNYQSIEDPNFDESRRAAKDGDDIEDFFDKHLGPPKEALAEQESSMSEVPISELTSGRRLLNDGDDEDHYETAASSPLSSIFHSILSAHKRPLVITTEEDPADSSTSSKSSNTQTSSSSLVGTSKRPASYPSGYYAEGAPLAYFAPMVASASEEGYEGTSSAGPGQQDQDEGVREIIITRRPASFINQLQSYSPNSGRLTQQSSNNHWQNADFRQTYGAADGSEQQDYSRYPVAASYAHQREQQQPESDDTVSYGLSFGASNDEDQPDEQQSNADSGSTYPEFGRMRNSASMIRPYQNHYQYQPVGYQPASTPMYNRQQQQQQQYYQQQMMQAQQQPYNGARYHKDPSESVSQPISSYASHNGAQYRQINQAPVMQINQDSSWIQRQRLLADLDKQIKNNPHYSQQANENGQRNVEQQSSNNYALRANKVNPNLRTIKSSARKQQQQQQPIDGDLDTYTSFHREIDPYKSFTSSSRIISEPAQSSISGYRDPINSNVATAGTQLSISNDNTDKSNLLTGHLVSNEPQTEIQPNRQHQASNDAASAAIPTAAQQPNGPSNQQHLRVRRQDSDDRDGSDDADDDGVWVDDDDDDDNRQQSSDLNETAQEPEEEAEEVGQQQDNLIDRRTTVTPPGVIGAPHGYELSPDDLTIYHG